MDRRYKSLRENQVGHRRDNPSFSSSLLEAIYHSIDKGPDQEQEDKLVLYREAMEKQKQSKFLKQGEAQEFSHSEGLTGSDWIEKKVSQKFVVYRNSLNEFDRRTRSNSGALSVKSSSSSSDSSSGGGFSSESESFHNMQRPKPIRTHVSSSKMSGKAEVLDAFHGFRNHSSKTQKTKHETGFVKTKSKALRILYGELKKAKHPTSPGAKLASFLNSLFTAGGNTKKAKVSNSGGGYGPKSAPGSTCSSASSFSRSCLSKTPSSRSGTKRSVRFCPVSVLVDEDSRPCEEKNLYEDYPRLMAAMENNASAIVRRTNENSNDEELKFHVMQESRRVEEFARELLKNHRKKNQNEMGFDIDIEQEEEEEEEDDDDDDLASCASSDLFELDNLSAIGIERYRSELPVYETTHFSTNRALANGTRVV